MPSAPAVGQPPKTPPGLGEAMDVLGCRLPEDLLYDVENGVWVRPPTDAEGIATLGVLASLAAFAGKFTSVTFRPVDGHIDRGRSVATVESVRYTGAVRLPVDGELLQRNLSLPGRPRLLNDAPYGEGWVVTFRPDEVADLARRLAGADAAAPRVREQILHQRIRCYAAIPDVELYEIGAECSAILARVDEELARREANDVLLLVTDDPTSAIELVRWSDRTGHTVLDHRREGTLDHFLLRKEADPVPRRPRR